jgi:hypothetical protein
VPPRRYPHCGDDLFNARGLINSNGRGPFCACCFSRLRLRAIAAGKVKIADDLPSRKALGRPSTAASSAQATYVVEVNDRKRAELTIAREADDKTVEAVALSLDAVVRALDNRVPRRSSSWL